MFMYVCACIITGVLTYIEFCLSKSNTNTDFSIHLCLFPLLVRVDAVSFNSFAYRQSLLLTDWVDDR